MKNSASSLTPDLLKKQLELAQQHLRAGRMAEAQEIAQQVVQQQPDEYRAIYLLALVADRTERYAEAVDYYRQVIALESGAIDAYNLLGNALQRLSKHAEAIPYYQKAIALKPDFPAAYNNMGAAYHESRQANEAIASYQKALKVKPDYVDVYYNLGNAYRSYGQGETAIAYYRKALELQPNYPKAYNNLGLVLYDLEQPKLAIQEYRKAIALEPNYADVHQNMGMALLLDGDLIEGFQEYEWRWVAKGPDNNPLPDFQQPLWDGSSLSGKTILLHAEQGQGDTLQFVRYASLIADAGARVIVQCQPTLQRLIATVPGVEQVVVPGDSVPHFDTHAPLLSLPRHFATTLETIPNAVPYLSTTAFESPLSALPRSDAAPLQIGIVWAGSPKNRNDHQRSCPLRFFVPLLQRFGQAQGVQWHSLQKGPRAPEIVPLVEQGLIQNWDDRIDDFADTAALINQLDLVITVDTSVGHLTGALGKPVWVLLSFAHDWRWLIKRSDSPWYPSARLFCQPTSGDWAGVMAEVIEALERLIEQRGAQQTTEPARSKASVSPSPSTPIATSTSTLAPLPTLTLAPSTLPSTLTLTSTPLAALTLTPLTPSPSHPAPPPRSSSTPIGIGWELGNNTGWRIYGLNLALQLVRRYQSAKGQGHLLTPPVPLVLWANPETLNPLQRILLQPWMAYPQQLAKLSAENPGKQAGCSFLVLKGMGNRGVMVPAMKRLMGRRNVGVIFSEDTQWEPNELAIAQSQDCMIAGSSWNADVLKSYGLSNVKAVFQGVDPTLFHPAPKANLFGDRFVIFSGGKLEYRKGQDIVVAAFKAFHARHPDSLLLTAWHNMWPTTMGEIEQAGHVVGLPKASQNTLNIKAWLIDNGLPETAVVDVGAIANYQAAPVVREADVAVFTNRAEGGTNLVAMECLACGIPTILSANTGHLDLIDEQHCYPLRSQGKVAPTQQFLGTEGWGESDVEEVVEALETVYQNRQAAQQRGQAAAQWMQDWTWEKQVDRLVEAIAPLLS